MIDNVNPFKHLITLSKELSTIRLQKDYLIQCQKNNSLISELSKEDDISKFAYELFSFIIIFLKVLSINFCW